MVGVVLYKMFDLVVACKKEDGREAIVDQWDLDISKAADTVVQTEYVCEESSAKRFEALVYWNLGPIHTSHFCRVECNWDNR